MITTLLIANRGEIAERIIRTARTMDIATVAVYSDADIDAPYVRAADQAVHLPGTAPADTYLRTDLILAAARATGADAVHPGYGFLSENEDFARSCAAEGIVFVGPSPEAIAAMGSKIEAKAMMAAAAVPVLPGGTVAADATGDDLRALAEDIGYPILVKAAFGGGGRGMRIVADDAQLVDAVTSAQREAASAFGDGTVFLEKFVSRPRHIEVQIFGDNHGTVVHLGERECSIQRRYQKIVEESPSTAVDDALRTRLGDAAVAAGRALNYEGAGTVEFVMAQDGSFYFLEVNTRLQVEHPVTELVTGIDLVRGQLLVASGQPLPPEMLDATPTGHAVEVRLYAEDVAAGFMPVSGTLHTLEFPTMDGLRVDAGFESGSTVSTFYDPMLAKVIGYGPDRDAAAAVVSRALVETRVHGVTTNRELLLGILREAEFRAGAIDTGYLDRHDPADLMVRRTPPGVDVATVHAAVAALACQARRRSEATVLAQVPSGFRTMPGLFQHVAYTRGETQIDVEYRIDRRGAQVRVGEWTATVDVHASDSGLVDAVIDGVRRRYRVAEIGEAVYVDSPLGSTEFVVVDRFPDPGDKQEVGSLLAPMPGTVVSVESREGDAVASGAVLIVLEAMKMEHSVTAPTAGALSHLAVSVGDQVDSGQVLAVVTEHDEDA